jgi:hypothetical protein
MYAHDKIGCMALEGPRKKYPGHKHSWKITRTKWIHNEIIIQHYYICLYLLISKTVFK